MFFNRQRIGAAARGQSCSCGLSPPETMLTRQMADSDTYNTLIPALKEWLPKSDVSVGLQKPSCFPSYTSGEVVACVLSQLRDMRGSQDVLPDYDKSIGIDGFFLLRSKTVCMIILRRIFTK